MSASPSYEPIEINAFFRSHTALPLWEILDKAGFWKQVGIKVNFRICDSSSEAEAALFSGKIRSDFRQSYLAVRVSRAGEADCIVGVADQWCYGSTGFARTN